MSGIAFQTNASGTGTLTVAAPNTNTNRTLTLPDETGTLISTTTPGYNGFKNRLINGQMQIAQRATSGTSGSTVPTTAPTYPSVDRWYAYATGATVTVAQVSGSGAIRNNLQVTGAASVTAVGIGQRIEALNCYDLAGSTATISVNISNSLLTSVTWVASYATSTDTWSSKTQIATGTITVNSTLTNYTAQISVPSAATTGIEILFTVGAQTSGTWVIGNVQFEKSSTATTFDYRPYTTELQLCQRYYQLLEATLFNIEMYAQSANYNLSVGVSLLTSMRAAPTVTPSATSGTLNIGAITATGYVSGVTTNAKSAAAGDAYYFYTSGNNFTLSAEL